MAAAPGRLLVLVVLAPVAAKHGGRMLVLVQDFTIHRSDDTVVGKMECT